MNDAMIREVLRWSAEQARQEEVNPDAVIAGARRQRHRRNAVLSGSIALVGAMTVVGLLQLPNAGNDKQFLVPGSHNPATGSSNQLGGKVPKPRSIGTARPPQATRTQSVCFNGYQATGKCAVRPDSSDVASAGNFAAVTTLHDQLEARYPASFGGLYNNGDNTFTVGYVGDSLNEMRDSVKLTQKGLFDARAAQPQFAYKRG